MPGYMYPHTHTQLCVLRHTLSHTHTPKCVCESKLSVLLSNTIHHRLLILLDHCRAFRTPRCSLKTQSEANALNPSNTHSSSHSQFPTHTLTRTLRGRPRSSGTSLVRLYKYYLNLIERKSADRGAEVWTRRALIHIGVPGN